MASRTYDIIFPCGCELSADGGGGLIPCRFDDFTDSELDQATKIVHDAAWKKFVDSGEQDKFNAEVGRRNS